MDKSIVDTPDLTDSVAAGRSYAQCVRVDELVCISGQAGEDRSGTLVSAEFDAQAIRALENLRSALHAGGSSLDDLVYVAAWVTDPRHIAEFESLLDSFMAGSRTAMSVLGTRSLSRLGQLVEIEARAVPSDSSAEKVVIDDPGLPTPPDNETYAPVVRAGDLVYLSGQLGVDRDFSPVSNRFEPQIVRVLDNVETGLTAGGSSLEDMLHMTTALTDLRYTKSFHHTRDDVLGDDHTTSTRVGTTDLRHPDLHVEMESMGVVSGLGKENVNVPDFPIQTIEKDGEELPRHWPVAVAGDWVRTAGAVPREHGVTGELVSLSFEPQVRKTFENMEKMLSAAGSSLEDVLHMRVYLRDMRLAEAFMRIRDDVLDGPPHASSIVQTSALGGNPGRLLELDGPMAITSD